jgi:YidC/Oxa1 family membrane protein insertase
MDKKNTVIGVLLLVAAFALMYFGAKTTPRPPAAPELAKPVTTGTAGTNNQAPGPVTSSLPQTGPGNAEFAALATMDSSAKVVRLSNDYIEARFVDFGGSIESVALKRYAAHKDSPERYAFNELHADHMLAFTADSFPGLDRSVRYEIVSQTANEVVFRTVLENRIEVTRKYTLATNDVPAGKGDPYQLRHETTFRNLGDQIYPMPRAALNLGTAAPVNANDYGQYLNVGYYDGSDLTLIDRGALQGGGFLSNFGIGSREPKPFIDAPSTVKWATVKNQFFAAILTPDQPGVGIVARRVELPPFPGSTAQNIGLTGSLRFDLKPLPAQGSETLSMSFYVGPKEYQRLENLGQDQQRVMQFDRFFFNKIFLSRYIAPALITLMNWCNSLVHNYGVAIILMTLILKTVFLPFTLAAARSSKRMQKIQPQMAAMREKYKDNPQKMNQATLELFKEHKVNPMGGCLPILITIPFFIAFFIMLQSASELRFAEFLWAKDLSAPDTVARIFGLPINIMPILMGATMIIQMHLAPTPTTDNAQAKMMKFMPYFFALVCYNFSCALALYSTVGNLFTIGQQLIINRMKDPEPVAVAAPSGRGMKNVTPAKKKLK